MGWRWVVCGLIGGVWAQAEWERFRPTYEGEPLPSAERPRLGDPRPIQLLRQASPAVTHLYDTLLALNRSSHTLPGYRVQVLTTTQRTLADSMRLALLEEYPTLPVYLLYEAPTYKLRVGDFWDRREAEAWLDAQRHRFPGAFVVPDKVLPP